MLERASNGRQQAECSCPLDGTWADRQEDGSRRLEVSGTLGQERANHLDGFLPHVYAPLVEVRHRTSRISTIPAMAFAVGALVMDVAVLVLPLHDGSSVVSLLLGDGVSFRVEIAYFLTLFAQAFAILVGLMLLRRGRATMASGVFVGLLVILGLHLISSVLTLIDGWVWQGVVALGLQTMECALLFLAARAARQQGT
jgi:hypothetical protein